MKFDQIKEWYIQNNLFFYASFELTQNCNFNCRHCYCPDKKTTTLSLDKAKLVVDKLYDMGCFLLIFTGGEILTYNHFQELYIYAKKKGFIIDLMTNGSLINEEFISIFDQLPPHNISVTVYGTNEEEYNIFTGNGSNFLRVMGTLELLKRHNVPFDIRTVATRTLYNSIRDGSFDRLAEKLRVPFRYDPIIFPKVSGEKSPLNECLTPDEIVKLESLNNLRTQKWKELVNSQNIYRWKCRAGINSLSIDYKGNAHVCGLYRTKGISFIENDVDEISIHLQEVHEQHECIINTNECHDCNMRKICKWCPAYANVYNGTESKKIPFFCELAKARSERFGI